MHQRPKREGRVHRCDKGVPAPKVGGNESTAMIRVVFDLEFDLFRFFDLVLAGKAPYKRAPSIAGLYHQPLLARAS
ncbi:hypothetical protein Y032_0088g2200 [Ancylostoma ceylanicum]|uniref:Uncharacterized protein n=1 Tax=Ancylostoma ceylanicum TaxID=53326 RepID=A0A016TP64_9BILA|nr:hypothetical protein Y032_0088g2200 [Ancylostoma ceylanicum]